MLTRLLSAFGLMALCVAIHAVGLTVAYRWLDRSGDAPRTFRRWTLLLIGITGWIVLVHLVEIAVWALFYTWTNSLPDLATAVYFSAVTYTTTGYGDLVLPAEWRLVGGVEALTGILMCGLSTGFFVAVISRIHLTTKGTRARA
jgi:Ion channel